MKVKDITRALTWLQSEPNCKSEYGAQTVIKLKSAEGEINKFVWIERMIQYESELSDTQTALKEYTDGIKEKKKKLYYVSLVTRFIALYGLC